VTTLDDILRLNDEGKFPADIATSLGITPGRVYTVLREHRPDRKRKPRPCTSNKPAMIRSLSAEKIKPSRIAFLLKCSRAYVYRHIGDKEK